MLNWQGCGRHERRIQEVFNLIFRNHPKLLDFLFQKDKPQLRLESERLLFDAGIFSSGEKILVRLALDLWDGSGKVSLWDIVERLDCENYRNVLLGLRHLRRIGPDGPEMCWRQPKKAY
jgi:hypothetical protein